VSPRPIRSSDRDLAAPSRGRLRDGERGTLVDKRGEPLARSSITLRACGPLRGWLSRTTSSAHWSGCSTACGLLGRTASSTSTPRSSGRVRSATQEAEATARASPLDSKRVYRRAWGLTGRAASAEGRLLQRASGTSSSSASPTAAARGNLRRNAHRCQVFADTGRRALAENGLDHFTRFGFRLVAGKASPTVT
jgi:hypothetical protein